jgi:hypothetical protein
MKNFKQLILWALESRDTLQFKYSVDNYENDLKAVTVSMGHAHHKALGFGFDIEMEKALGKAIAECIERITTTDQGWISSNGVAAHFNPEQAHENAYRELLERDSFLYYFQWGIKPLCISAGLFKLNSVDPRYQICMAQSLDQGILIGLGCSQLMEEGQQKAENELSAMQGYIKKSSIKALALDEFNQLADPASLDHLRLSQNAQYQALLHGWPNSGQDYRPRQIANPSKVESQTVNPPGLFKSSGLFVSRVENKDLLNLYRGMPGQGLEQQKKAMEHGFKELGEWRKIPHPLA